MKHPLDTYRKYPVFCQTVASEAKIRLDRAHAMGLILTVIFVLAGHPAAFSAIAVMVGAGAMIYYGSIGALLATNPYLGAAVVITLGTSLGRVITTIYKQRVVVQKFKECVVDRYEGDFLAAPDTESAEALHITEARAAHIEGLIERALVDFLNSLVYLGRITSGELHLALTNGGMLRR